MLVSLRVPSGRTSTTVQYLQYRKKKLLRILYLLQTVWPIGYQHCTNQGKQLDKRALQSLVTLLTM